MGWLRKKFKQVKNAVKKVAKGIKKVVKKVTKSKLFKVIATVGAVLATGGAALSAFGGKMASTAIGKAIINSGQFFAKFNPTSFKPFTATGKFLGSTLGKATDFVGLTDEATRLAPPTESIIPETITDPSKVSEAAVKTVDAGSKVARGTVLGDITRGVVTNVGTGMVMQQMQGDPKQTGIASGLDIQYGKELGNISVAYSDAGINPLSDVYDMSNNLTYGTASHNFNTPMYSGETVGLTPVA
jgi:hypothetical protein